MNLKKKTTTWQYFKNSSVFSNIIWVASLTVYIIAWIVIKNIFNLSLETIIFYGLFGVLLIFVGFLILSAFGSAKEVGKFIGVCTVVLGIFCIASYIVGYAVYKINPEIITALELVENNTITQVDIFSAGMLLTLTLVFAVPIVVCLLLILKLTIVDTITVSINSVKLYKKSIYIPITKEELISNGINTPQQLEDFFVYTLFADIKRNAALDTLPVYDAVRESYKNVIELNDYGLDEDQINELAEDMRYNLLSKYGGYLCNYKDCLNQFDELLQEILEDKSENISDED